MSDERLRLASRLCQAWADAKRKGAPPNDVWLCVADVALAHKREIRSARQLASKQRTRAQGLFPGGKVYFGYRVINGRMVEDPMEQGIILWIWELADRGMSIRQIEAAIGKATSRTTIGSILNGKLGATGGPPSRAAAATARNHNRDARHRAKRQSRAGAAEMPAVDVSAARLDAVAHHEHHADR